MDIMKKSIEMHGQHKGKLEIVSKVSLVDSYDLSLAYSPGVAAPCLEIEKIVLMSMITRLKGTLLQL